jgi:hypothetical protein
MAQRSVRSIRRGRLGPRSVSIPKIWESRAGSFLRVEYERRYHQRRKREVFHCSVARHRKSAQAVRFKRRLTRRRCFDWRVKQAAW